MIRRIGKIHNFLQKEHLENFSENDWNEQFFSTQLWWLTLPMVVPICCISSDPTKHTMVTHSEKGSSLHWLRNCNSEGSELELSRFGTQSKSPPMHWVNALDWLQMVNNPSASEEPTLLSDSGVWKNGWLIQIKNKINKTGKSKVGALSKAQ